MLTNYWWKELYRVCNILFLVSHQCAAHITSMSKGPSSLERCSWLHRQTSATILDLHQQCRACCTAAVPFRPGTWQHHLMTCTFTLPLIPHTFSSYTHLLVWQTKAVMASRTAETEPSRTNTGHEVTHLNHEAAVYAARAILHSMMAYSTQDNSCCSARTSCARLVPCCNAPAQHCCVCQIQEHQKMPTGNCSNIFPGATATYVDYWHETKSPHLS